MICGDMTKWWGSRIVALSVIARRHALLTETMIGLAGGPTFDMHQANHEDLRRFTELLEANAVRPITYAHRFR